MWTDDVITALGEIKEVYGLTCCVECIANNKILMSNGDLWFFDSNGHIYRGE